MTWLCVSILSLCSKIKIAVTALGIRCVVTLVKKNTWMISYSNKALMNFHYDAPSSRVAGINFHGNWHIIPIWGYIFVKLITREVTNFTAVICCLHVEFTCFSTKIYSNFFCFYATAAEKRVIGGPELRL